MLILHSVEDNTRLTMHFISCAWYSQTSTLLHPSVTGRAQLGALPVPQPLWCKDKAYVFFCQHIWTLMGERARHYGTMHAALLPIHGTCALSAGGHGIPGH